MVLVDDHPVVLEGLRQLMRTVDSLTVVGTASSGREAVALATERKPDLVVLDLRLPDVGGPEVCRRIKDASRDTKIIVFTAFDDRALLRACVDAGADGVLLKDQGDVISAIQQVLRGERVLDQRLALAGDADRSPASAPLTKRELEVMRLLAQGLNSRAIAESLHLAPNTVRSYVQAILVKLGAHNRIQAITRARELDLL